MMCISIHTEFVCACVCVCAINKAPTTKYMRTTAAQPSTPTSLPQKIERDKRQYSSTTEHANSVETEDDRQK